MAEPTPWRALLRTALRLGISPEVFWRLSLKEWRAFSASNAESLSRAAFETLTARFPDEVK
jgi:uncharacterized phage protein (TIGR02216 family)